MMNKTQRVSIKMHSKQGAIFHSLLVTFFYVFMTYSVQRKIKFTITKYIENICTWEKKKIKKRELKAINNIKNSIKKLNAIIYLNI